MRSTLPFQIFTASVFAAVVIFVVVVMYRAAQLETAARIAADETRLRELIRSHQFGHGHNFPSKEHPDNFYSGLTMPPEINRLYDKNPQATLTVLMDILEHGPPTDAICAIAAAVALVDGPTKAWPYIHITPESFNEDGEGKERNIREWLIGHMKEVIAKFDAAHPNS